MRWHRLIWHRVDLVCYPAQGFWAGHASAKKLAVASSHVAHYACFSTPARTTDCYTRTKTAVRKALSRTHYRKRPHPSSQVMPVVCRCGRRCGLLLWTPLVESPGDWLAAMLVCADSRGVACHQCCPYFTIRTCHGCAEAHRSCKSAWRLLSRPLPVRGHRLRQSSQTVDSS